MVRQQSIVITLLMIVLAGCSSTPPKFNPQLMLELKKVNAFEGLYYQSPQVGFDQGSSGYWDLDLLRSSTSAELRNSAERSLASITANDPAKEVLHESIKRLRSDFDGLPGDEQIRSTGAQNFKPNASDTLGLAKKGYVLEYVTNSWSIIRGPAPGSFMNNSHNLHYTGTLRILSKTAENPIVWKAQCRVMSQYGSASWQDFAANKMKLFHKARKYVVSKCTDDLVAKFKQSAPAQSAL